MAFWSKWLGAKGASTSPDKTLEYKGYLIEPKVFKSGSGWQLAGRIGKDGKSHSFVRADNFSNRDEAEEFALKKGQQIVDQLGAEIFNS